MLRLLPQHPAKVFIIALGQNKVGVALSNDIEYGRAIDISRPDFVSMPPNVVQVFVWPRQALFQLSSIPVIEKGMIDDVEKSLAPNALTAPCRLNRFLANSILPAQLRCQLAAELHTTPAKSVLCASQCTNI